MARHRSPEGRRTRLRLPLPPAPAAAGAAGGDSVLELAPRVLATLVAGGALAAAGHAALADALPAATGGVTTLTLGMQDLLGGGTTGTPAAAPALTLVADANLSSSPSSTPATAPEPRVADVSDLVKAAELHSKAASDAARRDAAARAAAAAKAAPRVDVVAEADAPEESRPSVSDGPADRAEQDAALSEAATGALRLVAGKVTSGFGARWGTRHNGLDIAAPVGTPVHVPLAGEVIDAGPASGFGLWVRVRHEDGTVTTYGHLHRALAQVGDRVAAGQKIAEVGNRGRSTGPHLHMEVQTAGGTTVNPRPWLDGHGIFY